MIFSENKKPTLKEFRLLMQNTDILLNREANCRHAYYATRSCYQVETDVYDALCRTAKGTPFEGSIQLVSGASFPDIVANKYYGVEVKTTIKDSWKSIGSSILESTRISDVERIFLTFGKLGAPVRFKSRPYEECLSGISVTHYPRYQIDMDLKPGETIFDKIGVPYDTLRKMDNPVAPVTKYYKKQLKPGESLWWADSSNIEDNVVPPTVRLWSTLSPLQKTCYTVQGYALFPEIISHSSPTKYQRYALWLATSCGIVNTNIRDQFSAGGKIDISTINGDFEKMPAAYGRIKKYHELIASTLVSTPEDNLRECWNVETIDDNRIVQWCQLAASYADEKIGYTNTYKMLTGIFDLYM